MPGYGIVGPDEGSGLLPWSWAEERLQRSHEYWLATADATGRPHVMPVWGVWSDGAAWCSSSPASRKARNISARPEVVLTTEDPLQPVVVEGRAEPVTERVVVEEFARSVNDKYSTEYPTTIIVDNASFRIDPVRVFALDEDDFTGTPTRWTFPDPG